MITADQMTSTEHELLRYRLVINGSVTVEGILDHLED